MIPSLNLSKWYHETSPRRRLLMLLPPSIVFRVGPMTPLSLRQLPQQLVTTMTVSMRLLTTVAAGPEVDRKVKDEADIEDEEDRAVTTVVEAVDEVKAVADIGDVAVLVGTSAVAREALLEEEMCSRGTSNA
jgi:hypothetical protein